MYSFAFHCTQVLQLGNEQQAEIRDLFFTHYPFLLANAVHWGFFYLCPGTHHLYGSGFKRILYAESVRLLSGVDMVPTCVLEMRARMFPDEASEDALQGAGATDSDYLPPLITYNASNNAG